MEIININTDTSITRVQTAGGIVFVNESWMDNKYNAVSRSICKDEKRTDEITGLNYRAGLHLQKCAEVIVH